MKNPHYELIWERRSNNPLHSIGIRMFYPKRIACPVNYYDPKYYALVNAWRMEFEVDPNTKDVTEVIRFICARLLNYKSQYFFVDEKFFDAIINTEPPEFTVSDIKLPLPAFTLVLPVNQIFKEFGCHIPYAMMTNNDRKDLFISYMVWDKDGKLYSEFTYSIKGIDSTAKIKDTTTMFKDVTEFEKDESIQINAEKPVMSDRELTIRVNSIIFKILLAAMTRNAFVEPLESQKPWGKDTPKVRADIKTIWNPRWIGRGYKSKINVAPIGHHASPETHWRRGHIRNQPYGVGNLERKVIWIEPVLVNS